VLPATGVDFPLEGAVDLPVLGSLARADRHPCT